MVLFLAQSSTGKHLVLFWLEAALGNLFLLLETLSLNSTGWPFFSSSGWPFSPPVVLFLAQSSTGKPFSPTVVLFLAQCSTGKPFSPPPLGNLFLLLWFCFWLKAALGNFFLLPETLSLDSTGWLFSPPVVLFLAQSSTGKHFSPPVVLFLAESSTGRPKAALGDLFLLPWFCFWPFSFACDPKP